MSTIDEMHDQVWALVKAKKRLRGQPYERTPGSGKWWVIERDGARPKRVPAPGDAEDATSRAKPKGTPTGTNVSAMHHLLSVSSDGLVPTRIAAGDLSHLRRCLDAGLLEPHGRGARLTQKGVKALREHGHEVPPKAMEHIVKDTGTETVEPASRPKFGQLVKDVKARTRMDSASILERVSQELAREGIQIPGRRQTLQSLARHVDDHKLVQALTRLVLRDFPTH